MTAELRTVALDAVHRAAGASMTAFAGWSMPVRYGSDLAEHHAVREAAGLFDVSHMGQLLVTGPDAMALVDGLFVSRVRDLVAGRARYTMLCDDQGGVIDDLIVTRLFEPDEYLIVANAANATDVLAVLLAAATGRAVTIRHAAERALLALQGPRAADVLSATGCAIDLDQLRAFRASGTTVAGVATLVSRTGYTGEDGFELSCAGADAALVWSSLLAAGRDHGVLPCGLAARDTLRLEAGLPLHGHELGAQLGPFETGFGRIVHLDDGRDFPGRARLAAQAASGPERRIVGLIAEGRRAPRADYPVLREGRVVGTVTSGAPSPTLGVPIALAVLTAADATVGTAVTVDVRGTSVEARIVDLPFVRRDR